MAKVGSLIASLGLDSAKFEEGLKKSGKWLDVFERKFKRSTKAMSRDAKEFGATVTKWSSVLATAGAAALTALTASSMEAADAQAKLADNLGIATDELAGFMLAGDLAGASAEQVQGAIEKMTLRIGDAAAGTKAADEALRRLGLSAAELVNLPVAEQFKRVTQALGGVGNATDRAGVAVDVFGKVGVKMLSFLTLSNEQLAEAKQRALDLGIALTRFESAQIEAANDAVTELKKSFVGIGNMIAVELSGPMTAFVKKWTDTQAATDGFKSAIHYAAVDTVKWIGVMVDALRMIGSGWALAKAGVLSYASAVAYTGTLMSRGFNALGNMIPGVDDVPFEQTKMGAKVKELSDAATEARAEVQKILMAPPAQQTLLDAFHESIAAGKDAAEQQVKTAQDAAAALSKVSIQISTPDTNEQVKKVTQGISEMTLALAGVGDMTDIINQGMAAMDASRQVQTGFWNEMLGQMDTLDMQFRSIFDNIDKGFSGMKDIFLDNLKVMIAALLRSQLMTFFQGNIAAGGFFAGGVGGVARKLMGFASGGSFEVGGRGGRDANLVAFAATKGEQVTVTKPGQSAGGGTVVINNSYDFSGRAALDVARIRADLDARDRNIKAEILDLMRRRRFA